LIPIVVGKRKIYQMDVKTAYISLCQAMRSSITNSRRGSLTPCLQYLLLLRRALDGLKQLGRAWYGVIASSS
jgi:hypothetical protein